MKIIAVLLSMWLALFLLFAGMNCVGKLASEKSREKVQLSDLPGIYSLTNMSNGQTWIYVKAGDHIDISGPLKPPVKINYGATGRKFNMGEDLK